MSANGDAGRPLPVTVLTGFLGAGKTTLLNRILSEPHGKRYVVIINEFGEIGIDHDLVVSSNETLLEMNNGCICCTVRGDLIKILSGILAGGHTFDGVLIETTGLADPGPVIQTFFVESNLAARFRLDAIVTVVDAHHVLQQLEVSHEAIEQIAVADVLIVNKVDLVSAAGREAVQYALRKLNPSAPLHLSRRCDVDLAAILDRRAFELDRILASEPDFLTADHAHEHDAGVQSISIRSNRPMRHERFVEWIATLLQERGADILRCKGIIDIAGSETRFAVQGVHMLLDGDFQRPWRAGETRSSRLVFIGRNLDAHALERDFNVCAAA